MAWPTRKSGTGCDTPDSDLVGLVYRFARPTEPSHTAINVGCGSGRHIRLLAEVGYGRWDWTTIRRWRRWPSRTARLHNMPTLAGFRPPERPHVVVAWGLMMLAANAPPALASWQPNIVVADWRTENNTCLTWPGNEKSADGSVLLRKPGHTLDGQRYLFHTLDECRLPGSTACIGRRSPRPPTPGATSGTRRCMSESMIDNHGIGNQRKKSTTDFTARSFLSNNLNPLTGSEIRGIRGRSFR